MNKTTNAPLQKVAEQLSNNCTGWIGKIPGNDDHFIKGQTFIADKEGDLLAIKVLPNMVVNNSHVGMTLHSFDPQQESWGKVIGSSTVELERSDAGKWISFSIPGAHLEKGRAYGFRLESTDSYMGVAEACGSFQEPAFKTGKEWQFINNDPDGDSYSYFSLAFKVVVAA